MTEPTTNQAALRDRIAAAIREAACVGDCGKTEEECRAERIQPFVWHHGRLAVVEGTPEQFADVVLAAVLSAVGARQDETAATETAALSPAERTMLTYALDQAQEHIWSRDGFTDEDQAAVDSLRRLTMEQPAIRARQDGAQR
ncbi:hypothetical protein [Streptomyces sp. AD55]|uniref:hypothetical protein n=1 Tax=Streptomyces sp. AD55 TaxID=3242895 RepID=UPI0035293826